MNSFGLREVINEHQNKLCSFVDNEKKFEIIDLIETQFKFIEEDIEIRIESLKLELDNAVSDFLNKLTKTIVE